MNKIYRLAIGAILLGITVASHASLVSKDLSLLGDGQLTYDSSTQLSWLDLTNTKWIGYDDILAGYGGYTTTLGYRYATGSEVATLLIDAGITEGRSTNGDIVNINNTRNLIYLLGITYSDGHTYLANGYISDPTPGVKAGAALAVNDIGEYDAFSSILITAIPNYFESTGFGSFLVKDVSNVPIPGATWLFGSALVGLVSFSRRKALVPAHTKE